MRLSVFVRVAIGTAAIGIGCLSAASAVASLEGRSVRVVPRIRSASPSFKRLEADCPRGYQLTGGGARARGTASILNTSIPNSAGTGWIAVGHRPGHNSLGLHVFAVCASPPEQGAAGRVVRQLRASYPNFTRLEVDCPAGYQLTGGGAEALGTASILNASIPNSTRSGWIAVGHQPGHDSVGLHVFAICVRMSDDVLTVRVGRRIRPSYPNFKRLEADCPTGYQLTGGGAEALGAASILNASIPNRTHTGWIAIGHQPGYSSVGLHVFAMCAATSEGDHIGRHTR
jgi:hypothetical protein